MRRVIAFVLLALMSQSAWAMWIDTAVPNTSGDFTVHWNTSIDCPYEYPVGCYQLWWDYGDVGVPQYSTEWSFNDLPPGTYTFYVMVEVYGNWEYLEGGVSVTVIDPPEFTISDPAAAEGDQLAFVITRNGASDYEHIVHFYTVSGTATLGDGDYAYAASSVSFPPSAGTADTQTVYVTTYDEAPSKVESSQYMYMYLYDGGYLNNATIADSAGAGTITNDDVVTFTINDPSAAEGTAQNGAVQFTVTMTGLTELSHSVSYATAATGSATAGTDFTSIATTTLNFSSTPTSPTTQLVNVTSLADSVSEQNETFAVNLSNPVGATTIGDSSGTGTINNDDAPGAPVNLTGPIGITGATTSAPLTWTAASGNPTHHEVERTLDGVVTTLNTGSSSASYMATGLTTDGMYLFRARACTSAGALCGAWSNIHQTVRSNADTTTGAPPAHDTTTSGDAGPSTGLTSFNGTVSGGAGVAPSGAATYSIPIAIPPGTRGMQPSLALVYNSHASNGTLGRGWSLAGAGSAVTRCGKTKAQDDIVHAVNYTANDRFCLDGQRLVKTSAAGVYGGDGVKYRTEIETFRDVTSNGGSASSPNAFTVRTPDGSTLSYGGTAASNFQANGLNSTEVAAWLLRRVEDLFGNFYTITYFEDETNGHYHVARIDYTGHTAAPSLPTYASVEFAYDAVANPIKQYRAGSVISVRQRLRKITAKNGASAVREYVLAYNENETVPPSGMARLTSVKECAPTEAGPCTAPTTFDWIDEVGGMQFTGQINTLPGGYQEWVDLNGDNRADLANFSTADGSQHTVRLSNGTGFASPQTWTKGSSTNTNYKFTDVDGDGDADFVSFGTATADHLVSRSNGVNGYLPTVAWPAHALMSGGHVFTDMNADGRTDFVTWQNTGDPDDVIDYFVSLSIGSGYAATQTWAGPKLVGTPGWEPDSFSFHDVNLDGRTDLVLVKATEHRIYVNNGSGFDPYFQVTAGWYSNGYWADVNGDSLLDYVVPGNPSHFVSLWTGKGYLNETWAGSPFVSQPFWRDMNGDGLADYIGGGAIGFSTGSGYVTSSAWSGFTGTGSNAEFPDVDGDGKPDYKALWYPTVAYHINQSQPVHLMRKVTDGLGMETVFTYEPVSNPSVYTKLTNATYPTSDFVNAVHVVSHVAQSSGSADPAGDGYFDTDYRYKGFKVDLSGRGSLGFAEVTAIDLDRKIQTVTTYSQTYPSTGFPTSVDVTVTDKLDNGSNSPQLISDSDRVYVVRNGVAQFDGPQIKYVCLDTDTTVEKDLESGVNLRTTLIDNDPGNSTVPCDAFGNPGQAGTPDPTHGTPLVRRLTVTDHVSGVAHRTDTLAYYVDAVGLGLGKLPKRQIAQPFVNGVGDATKDRTTAISYLPNKDEVLQIIREPDQPAPLKLTTTFEHDAFGNRKKETITPSEGGVPPNPPVRIERVDFDSIGRFPATLTNAKLQVTTLTFDAKFGAIATINGPNATISGFNDLVTRAYDGFGRLTYEQRPDGSYEVMSYLAVSQSPSPVPSGTAGLSPRPKVVVETGVQNTAPGTTPTVRQTPIRTFLDGYGRVQRARTRAFDDTNFMHADTVYDSRGRVQQASEPYHDGQTAVWNTPDYDVLGRVEGVVAADSTASTTTDYDGFTATTTDAGGRKNRLISDALGRPTRSEDLDSASSVRAITEYLYDKAGNLETTQKRNTGNTVISNTTITNVYDRLGRRTRTTDRDLTGNASSSYTDFVYDSLSDLRKQQTPLLRPTSLYTEFKFDELGRLIERKDPSNNLTATVTSTFTYDQTLTGCEAGVGQLTKEEIGGGGEVGLVTDYCYSPLTDFRGRLANEKRTTSGVTYETNFKYDAIGRLSQLRYPASSTAYSSRFAVNYKYNPRGYLQRVEEAQGTNAVLYQTLGANARGQIEKAYLGDGSRTTHNYIKNTDRLAFTNAASGAANLVQNFVYTYDTIANISGRADLINSVSETFGYDPLDRLTSSTVTNSTGTKPAVYYQYDSASLGNLTHKSDITTVAAPSMTYSATGRPHAVETLNTGAGTRTFTYNLNGAMTGGQVDSAARTITWTSYDLPASVTIGTTSRTFSYGTDRARYRQVSVAGATTRTYTYIGEHYVKEVEGSSTEYKLYFFANGEQVGYVSDDGTPDVRYFHKDHLGSITTIVTNQNIAGREKLSYDAWGKRRSGTDWFSAAAAATEERGYTGHEHLDNVNLIHMNGRLLDPKLGRVISADPFVPDPLYSQSYNRFSYVYNNPLKLTDPSGFGPDDVPRPPRTPLPGPIIPIPSHLPPHCFNPGQVYCMEDGKIHDNPFTEEFLNAMFPPEPPPAPLPRTRQSTTDTQTVTPTVGGMPPGIRVADPNLCQGRSGETCFATDLRWNMVTDPKTYYALDPDELYEFAEEWKDGELAKVELMWDLAFGTPEMLFGAHEAQAAPGSGGRLGVYARTVRAFSLRAVQMGKRGEAYVRALHNIGPKPTTAIKMSGRDRIPDGMTATVLSEVKNVRYLSYTQQLRDYAAFAQQKGMRFDLYVRMGTKLSGPLDDAASKGLINVIPLIP